MILLASILRMIRLWAIALWVGGIVFFIAVAQVAFTNLPTTHEAGLVVRGSLVILHNMGIGEGLIFVLCTSFLMLFCDGVRRLRVAEMLLAFAMVLLTFYSQYKIIPTMERDRIELFQHYGAEVDATPRSDSAHAEFDRLHSLSTRVEGLVLVAGLATLALGVIPRTLSRRETSE